MYLGQENEFSQAAQKRLFVGLLGLSLLLLVLCAGVVWWVILEAGNVVNRIVLITLLSLMIIFFVLMSIGQMGMVWSIWSRREMKRFKRIILSSINVLYPFALWFGKLFRVNEDLIKNSFVQLSNHLVKTRVRGHAVERVLILAPHCLQRADCTHKITLDINRCEACGCCPIGTLKEIAADTNSCLMIATGGTAARRIILDYRPQGVVAVACERDLTSGIRDMKQFNVIGVLNERPNGPCYNTRVDMDAVRNAIQYFHEGE